MFIALAENYLPTHFSTHKTKKDVWTEIRFDLSESNSLLKTLRKKILTITSLVCQKRL